MRNVTIPNSVSSITEGAFAYCTGITNVTIPDSVTSIGDRAFYSCSLMSISIPNSVSSIGERAFYWARLSSITIPNSVNQIGDQAFFGLTKAAILGETLAFGDAVFPDSVTIYCYKSSDADVWAKQNGLTTVYLDNIDMDDIRTLTLENDFQLAVGETRQIAC